MQTMYYIGLDVHKRTISYCVKGGNVGSSTRVDCGCLTTSAD
jgi:hypothetical protein